jgi:RNA recognition motif-containing protein
MNIYVSSLGSKVTDEDLKKLFSEFGQVSSAKVINDKFTGVSRGFAFVEMNNDAEGQQAIDKLDNTEHDGKMISVKVARPKEDRSGSYPARGSGGGNGGYRKF